MLDKMSQLRSRHLPRGGTPTKALTHSSRFYRQFTERVGNGSERHITTYSKDDSKDVLSTTSTSSARSSTAAKKSSCSQEEQLGTSLEVQADDLTGKHRDVERNPLERPQVSEDEDKVVADGTSHADQGGDFVFQTEVGMDLEISQITARHFELAMFRQLQGTTAKIIDSEVDYLTVFKQIFGGTRKQQQHKSPLARTLRSAGTSERTLTKQNKQLDPAGSRIICSFLPKWL